MPRKQLMSWDAKNRRWLKEYRGKKRSISCRQLGVPETKEESYQAANEWWIAEKAKLDLANRPAVRTPLPMEDVLGASVGDPVTFTDRDKALRYMFARIMQKLKTKQQAEEQPTFDPDEGPPSDPNELLLAAYQDVAEQFIKNHILAGEPLPDSVKGKLSPTRLHQIQGGIDAIRGVNTAPADRRLSYHRDRWFAARTAQIEAGGLTPGRVDTSRIALNHFLAFVGEESSVEVVNVALVQDFYVFCLAKVKERNADSEDKAGWGSEYAKKVFATVRMFIRYLADNGLIELPANVERGKFRFGTSAKTVPTWTVEEFQKVLKAAAGQLRLHLLLMVNCGMTQIDISDLRDDEVDWTSGRITRKRSKTAGQANVPTVQYLLWPRTFELLQEYRSGGELVLLRGSGQPWVHTEIQDGKLKKSDAIAFTYASLKRRLKGFNKPLKQLRKTASTLLEDHEVYGRYPKLFLGHAPRSIADKSYVRPSQERFDEAVLWLGQQFGMVEATEKDNGKKGKKRSR